MKAIFQFVKDLLKDKNLSVIKTIFYSIQRKMLNHGSSIYIGKKTKAIINMKNVYGDGKLYINKCHNGKNNLPGTIYIAGKLHINNWFHVYSGGVLNVEPGGELTLGSGFINNGGKIYCFHEIKIGENVKISENVIIRDSDDHQIDRKGYEKSKPIYIGDHVWIGMGAIILKGVNIGDGAVIGAGSIVNKDVPPNTLCAGCPARVIKENIKWY